MSGKAPRKMAGLSRGKIALRESLNMLKTEYKSKRKRSPREEARYWCMAGLDQNGFIKKFISEYIGYGVFTETKFYKGDFLLEYCGERISTQEMERRESQRSRNSTSPIPRCYVYGFRFSQVTQWIDATDTVGHVCQFANDAVSGDKQCNARMKLETFNGYPRLCLFATRDLGINEEIRYDYGDTSDQLFWRYKKSAEETEEDYDSDPFDLLMDKEKETEYRPSKESEYEADDSDPGEQIQINKKMKGQETESEDKESEVEDPSEQMQMDKEIEDQETESEYKPSKESEDEDPSEQMQMDKEIEDQETESEYKRCKESEDEDPSEKMQMDKEIEDQETESEYKPSKESEDEDQMQMDKEIEDQETESEYKPSKESEDEDPSEQIIQMDKEIEDQETESEYKRSKESEDEDPSEQIMQMDKEIEDQETESEYKPSKESEDESDDSDQMQVDEDFEDQETESEYKPSKESEDESDDSDEMDPSEQTQMDEEFEDQENSEIVCDSEDETASVLIPLQNERNVILQSPVPNKGAKRANKYHACIFCGKTYFKLPRHLEDVHYSETKVRTALSYPKRSKERKNALLEIQNLGDYNHNVEVLKEGKGVIIPKYTARQNGEARKYQSYVPCKFCLAMYVKDELWKHQKRCRSKTGDEKTTGKKSTPILDGRLLLPPVAGSEELNNNILLHMKEDDIKEKIVSDKLILEYGRRLFEYHGHEVHRHQYISQKMRELGRFLIVVYEEENIRFLEESLYPENWESVIKSVKNVAGFSAEKGIFRIPSLALKIGYSLKKCAKVNRTKAIQTGDEILRNRMQAFLDLHDTEWTERIASHAHSTLHKAKFNRPQLLPLVDDVVVLHKHLDTRTKQIHVSSLTDKQKYRDLAEICLARLILFNRKRSGEAQRMTLKSYEAVTQSNTVDDEILKSITPFEKELCKTHTRIEIMGKKGSKVPVILTEKMVTDIKVLLELRKNIDVPNDYLFGKPDSRFPLRGNDCLRRLAFEAGAKKPELIKSTELRKQLGTLSQVLGLTEGNLDILAKFMGHDVRIHKEYYRLPESSLQLAKVTKVLHAINSGKLAEFRGKNLDDIEFHSEETLEEEFNEDSDEDQEFIDNEEFNDEDMDTKSTKPVCSPRSTNKRRKWRDEEIQAVERQLRKFLKMRQIPGKRDCDTAKHKEKSLEGRTWQQIKHYVRNRNLKISTVFH